MFLSPRNSRDALELADAFGLASVAQGSGKRARMMEEQVFGKMRALSLRLDVSNTSGSGSRGTRHAGRDDRARRRKGRGAGAHEKTNRRGETRVRLDLGSADGFAGWSRIRNADASAPWSLEITRANAETLRLLASSRTPHDENANAALCPEDDSGVSFERGGFLARSFHSSPLRVAPNRNRLNDALANLTSLSLRSGRGVGDEGAAQLARALRGAVPSLRSLDVSGNDLGKKAARALADALCWSNDSENVFAAKTATPEDGVADSPVRALGNAGGCALEHLDLSGNHIGTEGACALADALVRSGCPRLKTLDVSRNLIGAAGVAAVAELLVAQATRRGAGFAASVSGGDRFRAHALCELGLRHNGCGDAGAAALAAAMRKSAELSARGSGSKEAVFSRADWTRLNGSTSSSTDASGPVAHSLDVLKLGFNGIGPAGASALAEAIKAVRAASRASLSSPGLGAKSVVVGELDLACNAVGPEGARALGAALDDGVAKLDLGNNAILCAGAKELARALVTNAATTELCLAGNEIKAEGAWWIAEFFSKTKRVSRLSTLDLGSNAVGDAGACDLAEEFGECGSLRHLDLRRNDITNVGATSFCEAFRKLDEAAARKQEHPGSSSFFATAAPSVCLRGNAVDAACQTSIRERFGLRIDVELQVKRAARHAH